MIPVDHGLCLPDVLDIGWCDWCWLDWPQCKVLPDAATLRYVELIDPHEDSALIRQRFGLPDQCATLITLSGLLLKKGLKAGLTIFEVASMIVRQDVDNEEPSELERLYHHANDMSQRQDTNAPWISSPFVMRSERPLESPADSASPLGFWSGIKFNDEPCLDSKKAVGNSSPGWLGVTTPSEIPEVSPSSAEKGEREESTREVFWRAADASIAALVHQQLQARKH